VWFYGAVEVGASGGNKTKVVGKGFDVDFILAAVIGIIDLDAFESGFFEAVYQGVEFVVGKIIEQRVCQYRYAACFFMLEMACSGGMYSRGV